MARTPRSIHLLHHCFPLCPACGLYAFKHLHLIAPIPSGWDSMEGSTGIVLAIIVLAAGGAAGAAMMADGSLMGGSDGDASGLTQVEPLPYSGGDGGETCSLGRDAGDCGQASEGCSQQDDGTSTGDGGGCCC